VERHVFEVGEFEAHHRFALVDGVFGVFEEPPLVVACGGHCV